MTKHRTKGPLVDILKPSSLGHVELVDLPVSDLASIGSLGGFYCPPGDYRGLHIGGRLVMSDTRMELVLNSDCWVRAWGHVLLVGLGIGLHLTQMEKQRQQGRLTQVLSVTVLERERNVIDLVWPQLKPHLKTLPAVDVIHGDAHSWEPDERRFNWVWLDIWPNLCEDDLPEHRTLRARARNRWCVKGGKGERFVGSWGWECLRDRQRRGRQI